MWQRQLVDWLAKWRWAEDCPEAQRITWLELMAGFEADTGGYVTGTEILSTETQRLLQPAHGIGQEVARFRSACLQLLSSHFTIDARGLFVQKGRNAQKGESRLMAIGIR